jgi:hypothetical protein
MNYQRLLQTILAAIGITFLYFLLQLSSDNNLKVETLHWNFLSNLLIAGVLGFYAIHSGHYSYKLLIRTFIIFYVIGYFNIIIEALIFGVFDRSDSIESMLIGIPYSFMASAILIWIFGRFKKNAKPLPSFEYRKRVNWIGKILLANFIYIFFYLIAGMLIDRVTPGFMEFYEGRLPSPTVFFMTNMFFRGFVFVAIAILIDRSTHGTVITKALLVALVYSVIGGIAPLIPPSEFMPEFIRIAHGFEVGISNFLYGICVFLIVRSREKLEVLESQEDKTIDG